MNSDFPVRVVATETVVSVMIVDGFRSIACADMDLMENYWWLSRLKVDSAHRRKGYGRILIEHLTKHANGLMIVVAPGGYIDTSMDIKLAFYRACGFVDFNDDMLVLDTKVTDVETQEITQC